MAESGLCAGCLRGDGNNTGEAWCCDCAELVCKTCSNCHTNMSPSHKVIPIEKVSRISPSLLKLSRYCELHNDQKIILFCCQHDQLLCGSCVSESHQNCKPVISIEIAAKEVQTGTAVTDLEKRMDSLTQIMGNILNIYNTELSNLCEQKKNIKKEVADIKRKIISHLDKLEADFNKELDSKINKCREQITKNNSDIQLRYDTLTTWKEDMESLKHYTSNVHLFHAIKYLDGQTRREEAEFRNIKTDVAIPTLTFRFSDEISKIHEILPLFGALSLETKAIPIPLNLDIDQQGQAIVRAEVLNRQLSLVTSFGTEKLGDETEINKGCFVPDNKLLLCDFLEKKVYLCDHDGSKPQTIDLDYDPHDVTLYDRDTAIVSAGETGIQIINLNQFKPGRLKKVGSDCKGISSLAGKICIKSDFRTLTLIDIEGNVQKNISTSFEPIDICLSKDGDIYCTDCDSDDVYVVSSDGEERVVYSSPDLRGADGITVDDHDDVYIAGNNSHNIHRISSDGQQSSIILTEEDGIHEPSGLSFDHQTKELMVVNNDWKSINIIKVS